MNIEKASAAKQAKYLDKLIRYNGCITTKKEYLEKLKSEGRTPEIGSKPAIHFSRQKYNRMADIREQDEYMRRSNETVPEYRAISAKADYIYSELTKTEYDYFVSLFPKEDETGPEYATDEQLNHLFGINTKG